MTWAACEAYWTALEVISCFFWHKLKNTKRFYRRRFEDMEEEFSTTDTDSSEDYESIRVTNRQKSVRDKRKDRVRQFLHPKNHSSLKRRQRSGLRHHVRLKTSEVSVHVEDSRRRKRAGLIQVRILDRNCSTGDEDDS